MVTLQGREAFLSRLWGRWNIKIPNLAAGSGTLSSQTLAHTQKQFSLVLGKVFQRQPGEDPWTSVTPQDNLKGIAFFIGELNYNGNRYLLEGKGGKRAEIIGPSLKVALEWILCPPSGAPTAESDASGTLTLFFNGLDIDGYASGFPGTSYESIAFEARFVRKLTLAEKRQLLTWTTEWNSISQSQSI